MVISKAAENNPAFNNIAIYGGWKGDDSSGAAIAADNTLEIKTKGLSGIKEVNGFKNYHFILPADIKAGEAVLNAEEVDISNSKITVSIASGGKTALQKGDQITLIKAETLTYANYTKSGIKAQQGVISLDDYTLNANSSTLTVKITSDVSPNP